MVLLHVLLRSSYEDTRGRHFKEIKVLFKDTVSYCITSTHKGRDFKENKDLKDYRIPSDYVECVEGRDFKENKYLRSRLLHLLFDVSVLKVGTLRRMRYDVVTRLL